MPTATEVALISVPMAAYLYALGLFHGGKHPRVVAGMVDLGWLVFGLSGLVAFGPFGRVVVAGLFGLDATVGAWMVWGIVLVVSAALVIRTGRNRVVIYHVAGNEVRAATERTLEDLDRSFTPTLNGFEDRSSRTGVLIRTSDRTRTAVVETQGDEAGRVMASLRLGLKANLRGVNRPVSTVSTAFFVASGLVMLAPVAAFIAFDPQGRRAVRTVGRWLGWG